MEWRIKTLSKELDKMNHDYYVVGNGLYSDYEYDMKLKELQNLEVLYPEFALPTSPTQRVGSDRISGFTSVKHETKMLSLDNSYNIEEVEKCLKRIAASTEAEIGYVTEIKIDGASIELVYEDGVLTQATTRGDGEFGDDVTENVKTIRSVPLKLKGEYKPRMTFRGEIVMPKKVLLEINAKRTETGEKLFANARNAASGSLKSLEPKEVAKRKLDCIIFESIYESEKTVENSHHWRMLEVESLGFKTIFTGLDIPMMFTKTNHKNIAGIKAFIDVWETRKDTLPYLVDGIVIKVDSISLREVLGAGSKYPNWAFAYKYKAEEKSTLLKEIIYQVGTFGSITPVGKLETIVLSDTNVSNVMMNNPDWIADMDIREGDSVIVEKGGEIIPKILRVDLSKRLEGAKPIKFITHCPCCGSELSRKTTMKGEDTANIFCLNSEGCADQVIAKIKHLTSKKAMDIQGLGAATVRELFEKGLVKSPVDVYRLTLEDLEGNKIKNSKNIYNSIQNSKNSKFYRVIYSLGIPTVGTTTSKFLAERLENLEQLKDASYLDLKELGLSEGVREEIHSYRGEYLNGIMEYFCENGFNTNKEEASEKTSSKLVGKNVIISGNFGDASRRKYLESLIIEHGGKKQSSVSKKTSFVVEGEKMGWSKKEKAIKLGIPLITEEDYLKMLD